MKKIFFVYIIIGLVLSPFIYSNNAEGYRDSRSTSYHFGKALGGSLYWPSYLFSIEPEADGDSQELFQQSIIDIINYRNDKLFTGQKNHEHGYMVMSSLGSCLALDGLNGENLPSLFEKVFNKKINNKELDRIRKNIMERMDGYDFSDIVEEGAECEEELQELLSSGDATSILNNAIVNLGDSSDLQSKKKEKENNSNLQIKTKNSNSIYQSKKINIFPSSNNIYTSSGLLTIGCDKSIYPNEKQYDIICNIVKDVLSRKNTYPLQELMEFGAEKLINGKSGDIIDSLILYSDEVWKEKENNLEIIEQKTSTTLSAIRFGSLEVNNDNILLYNGQPLFPNIQGNSSLSVLNIYHNDSSDIVLIQNNGGTACPALLHIVEISNSHHVIATSEFGSCSDLVSFKKSLQGITVTMPEFQGPFEPESNQKRAASQKYNYLYKEGKLIQSIDFK